MRNLFITLSLLYAGSLGTLLALGQHPPLAWMFLAAVAVLFVPFAYGLVEAFTAAENRLAWTRYRMAPVVWPVMSAGVFGGLMVLGAFPQIALTLAILFVLSMQYGHRDLLGRLLTACCALTLLYGMVWNANLLVGLFASERLNDAQALAWDLNTYALLSGGKVSPVGMFPLIHSSVLFSVMEAAYHALFIEVFVVVIVLSRRGAALKEFLCVTLASYLVAAAAFVLYPLVGPCIYFPETFASEFRSSQTFRLMESMAESFRAIASGTTPGGYTYFVALPSMHVAMAIILQRYLASSRTAFWVFLPVNCLMALSTVFLGYHYFADLGGGVLLAVVALAAAKWWDRTSLAMTDQTVKSLDAGHQPSGALIYL